MLSAMSTSVLDAPVIGALAHLCAWLAWDTMAPDKHLFLAAAQIPQHLAFHFCTIKY